MKRNFMYPVCIMLDGVMVHPLTVCMVDALGVWSFTPVCVCIRAGSED